ncbi:sirohydrochlorin cobaltochelatase [Sulfolobales archaeon HS-7]|nr:sirohydrochlorin cobaltochelatase [Sulfolobales archaeon HS-7]
MLGVLLVLHGSRIESWQETALGYVNLLRKHFDNVEYGFIEFNTPTLREAAEKLASKGVSEIVAVPLLFAAGTHFKRDIPRLLNLEGSAIRVGETRIPVRVAEPIGVDERISQILKERVEEALAAGITLE